MLILPSIPASTDLIKSSPQGQCLNFPSLPLLFPSLAPFCAQVLGKHPVYRQKQLSLPYINFWLLCCWSLFTSFARFSFGFYLARAQLMLGGLFTFITLMKGWCLLDVTFDLPFSLLSFPTATQKTTQQGPHEARLRYRAQSISRGISGSTARLRCRLERRSSLQQNHGTTESENAIAKRFHVRR